MSREYIANTLKRLREATGLKADEVGAMIGKSGKTVNAWENGRGQPDAEILIKLCSIYKVSNILEEFDDKNIITKQSSFSADEITHIKKYRTLDPYGQKAVTSVLDIEFERCTYIPEPNREELIEVSINYASVSAGFGDELEDYEQWEKASVPLTPESRKADFILVVDGDSMEPKFHNGDYILVRKQPAVDIGQIGIFGVDGKGYIKKYGGDKLISLNKKYPDIPLDDESRCFGLVLGVTDISE